MATAHTDDPSLSSAASAFSGLIPVAALVVIAPWVASLVVGPTQIHDAADERPPRSSTSRGHSLSFATRCPARS